jgi:hypothetical protein
LIRISSAIEVFCPLIGYCPSGKVVMEIVTGRLAFEDLEDAFASLMSILLRLDVDCIGMEFGSGCDFNKVTWGQRLFEPVALLSQKLDNLIEAEIIELGKSEVLFSTDYLNISILICEMCELHFSTTDQSAIDIVSEAWLATCPDAYFLDRPEGRMRRLIDDKWVNYFTTGHAD